MVVFPNFDPVAIHLGPVALRWYALSYIAGIGLGLIYALRLLKRGELWGPKGAPLTPSELEDLLLWVILGVIIGGRLGYMVFYDTPTLWTNPIQIFKVWEGGMSFHGGFMGVVVAVIAFASSRRPSGVTLFGKTVVKPHAPVAMLSIGDLLASSAPIGLFLGRIANFINGELWGRPTAVPWGMVFCNEQIQKQYGVCPAGAIARHPSQLYEAALEGLVLFALLRLAAVRFGVLKRPGAGFGLFLLLYAASRIALENVRQPDAQLPNFPLGVTMGMMLSAPMIAFGVFLLYRAYRSPPPGSAA